MTYCKGLWSLLVGFSLMVGGVRRHPTLLMMPTHKKRINPSPIVLIGIITETCRTV